MSGYVTDIYCELLSIFAAGLPLARGFDRVALLRPSNVCEKQRGHERYCSEPKRFQKLSCTHAFLLVLRLTFHSSHVAISLPSLHECMPSPRKRSRNCRLRSSTSTCTPS